MDKDNQQDKQPKKSKKAGFVKAIVAKKAGMPTLDTSKMKKPSKDLLERDGKTFIRKTKKEMEKIRAKKPKTPTPKPKTPTPKPKTPTPKPETKKTPFVITPSKIKGALMFLHKVKEVFWFLWQQRTRGIRFLILRETLNNISKIHEKAEAELDKFYSRKGVPENIYELLQELQEDIADQWLDGDDGGENGKILSGSYELTKIPVYLEGDGWDEEAKIDLDEADKERDEHFGINEYDWDEDDEDDDEDREPIEESWEYKLWWEKKISARIKATTDELEKDIELLNNFRKLSPETMEKVIEKAKKTYRLF